MKKGLLSFAFIIIFFNQQATAQFIAVDSIIVTPQHPVRNDTVSIDLYVSLICASKKFYTTYQLHSDTIDIEGCYSISGATAMTFFHDTLNIGPLKDGVYYINYKGYASSSFDSCTVVHPDSTIVHDTFVVDAPVLVPKINSQLFSIYPNPATNTLYIRSAGNTPLKEAVIYNTYGALMGNYDGKGPVDIAHFAPGIYFIKLFSDEGSTTYKFLKQ